MKKKKGIKALKIIVSIVLVIALFFGIATAINAIETKANGNFIKTTVEKIDYDE